MRSSNIARFMLVWTAGICSFAASAQHKLFHIWYFGHNAGISFHTDPPTALHNSQMSSMEGSTGICDEDGNLLFYTNGDTVFNRNHQALLNSKISKAWRQSAVQAGIVVPVPGKPRKYYLLTALSIEYYLMNNDADGMLSYSVIDMDGDGGLGEMTVKEQPLLPNPREQLGVTLHENGQDYWVATIDYKNGIFNCIRTVNGEFASAYVSTALVNYQKNVDRVNIKFSPDGNYVTVRHYWGTTSNERFVEVYRFDKSTGNISAPLMLRVGYPILAHMVEFSPDSRFLYIADQTGIRQFDMSNWSEAAVNASMEFINNPARPLMCMQLGPDGRIYCFNIGSDTLSVIQEPTRKGAACSFIRNGPKLAPEQCGSGGPYYPTFWFRGISLPQDTLICEGDSLHIPVGGAIQGRKFLWSTGDTGLSVVVHQPGKYWVKTADAGIVYSDTMVVKVAKRPVVYLGPDTAFCNAFSHILNAGKQKSYLWNTGETTMQITVTQEGLYSVQVLDSNTCANGDTIRIDKQPVPEIVLTYDLNCKYVHLRVVNPLPGVHYTWNTGDTGVVLNTMQKGTFTVTAVHQFCSNTASIEVDILPVPEPDLGPDTVLCGFPLLATAETGTYLWNTGEQTSSITPKAPGTYWVKVTRNGCTAMDTVKVLPCRDMTWYIPSAFTPNNDGLNEVFGISGTGVQRVHLQVFNRWGEKIYDEDGQYIAWEGSYRNSPCAEGVYMYLVTVWGYHNNLLVRRQQQGSVTLIR